MRRRIVLRAIQKEKESKAIQNPAVNKVELSSSTSVSSTSKASEYYEVLFAKGFGKNAKQSEGYFRFVEKGKCALFTLRGTKLAEDFFVSTTTEKDKRAKSIDDDNEYILTKWKIEICEKISEDEFNRITSKTQLSNKKTRNKYLQNLKPLDNSSVGHRLLMQMGWKEGSGLGRLENGDTEPLGIFIRDHKQGLGC